ncbi:MAG: inorganic phosphate transporter [Gemmataceae bacterium]
MIALVVAFGFEFINGFHDTANAVTTVIYTRSMKPRNAVLFSGFMNFLGVLLGGTGVAFGIVNLLPVERLVSESPNTALVMVLAMLIAAVIWNLGTWYIGLPVSSSHTLIGSIIGVGIAHGLQTEGNMSGVRWDKAVDTGLALLLSPLVGFILAGGLLLVMKRIIKDQRLYEPPPGNDKPPGWVKWAIRATCGGVSFFHGSNDGQKGMGLLMLVLVGFLPTLYALHPSDTTKPAEIIAAAKAIQDRLPNDSEADKFKNLELFKDIEVIKVKLDGLNALAEVKDSDRWTLRQSITRVSKNPNTQKPEKAIFDHSVQYIPFWVIFSTALCLGIGTTIGYKRIVVTVAEKIGRNHLTYAQGAAAELVAAITIMFATEFKLPVSTTHVLSSGVAGTMAANRSGLQGNTIKRILLAWVFTLPACVALSAILFWVGRVFIR